MLPLKEYSMENSEQNNTNCSNVFQKYKIKTQNFRLWQLAPAKELNEQYSQNQFRL